MKLLITDPSSKLEFLIHDHDELSKSKQQIEYNSNAYLDEIGYNLSDNNAPIYLATIVSLSDDKIVVTNAEKRDFIDSRTAQLRQMVTDNTNKLYCAQELTNNTRLENSKLISSVSKLKNDCRQMTIEKNNLLSELQRIKTELSEQKNSVLEKNEEFRDWTRSNLFLKLLYFLYKLS